MRLKYSLLCLLLLTACSGKQGLLQPPAEKLRLSPAPVELKPIRFKVIGSPEVLICMDPQGYKNLSTNLEQLKGYITEQNVILNEYRKFYESPEK